MQLRKQIRREWVRASVGKGWEGCSQGTEGRKEKERGKPCELLDKAWIAKRALPGRQQ